MTTSPVTTVTDELLTELEEAAESVKGWNMDKVFQEPEECFLPADWEWYVGQIDEDDNRYPVLNVNAHQYDSEDSENLARYYAACNRDKILSITKELRRLRAENAEMAKDAGRYRYLKRIGRKDIVVRDQVCHLFQSNLDSAVDTAMATQ